ncbi:hypothetical protein KM043_016752 [Ampulex compressa]|nr:hypothetical protein KM043_016752 [Ampulex compressa]
MMASRGTEDGKSISERRTPVARLILAFVLRLISALARSLIENPDPSLRNNGDCNFIVGTREAHVNPMYAIGRTHVDYNERNADGPTNKAVEVNHGCVKHLPSPGRSLCLFA